MYLSPENRLDTKTISQDLQDVNENTVTKNTRESDNYQKEAEKHNIISKISRDEISYLQMILDKVGKVDTRSAENDFYIVKSKRE